MHYACPRPPLLFLIASAVWAGNVSGTGNGGRIPAGAPSAASGTFSSDVLVSGGGIVASGNAITVVLKGLQHDWSGDLIATLSYLDAQGNTVRSANLFYRIGTTSVQPGGAWASFGAPGPTGDNYTFNSDAAGNIWSVGGALGFADSIPGQQIDTAGGKYFTSDAGGARNNLSYAFAGLDTAAGTWRLTITDVSDHSSEAFSVPNTGSLVGWELDIQTVDGSSPRFTVSPASGSGSSQNFTIILSGANFEQAHLLFNSSLSGINGCYLLYWPSSGGLFLLSDDGNLLLGPVAPGSSGTLSNSQCSIAGSAITASVSGTQLIVTASVLFTPAFQGAKNTYLAAFDTSWNRFEWITAGTWTITQ